MTLVILVIRKNFEDSPITRTLPQVKSVTLWKPIIRSVIKKDTINAGINLKPNIAGT